MLRDNLVGLIEPMLNSAGAYSLALCTEWKPSSDDRPRCLENPRPEGAESTLTENACSPFHAEPRHPDHSTPVERAKAEERMKLINIAYEILSDSRKRAEYDKKLED